METIKLTYPHHFIKEDLPATVAAIGFFDGIHKGHQKVINTAIEKAKQLGIKSSVVTFSPHPSVVLKPEKKHVQYITPLNEKIEILDKMGVDRLYIITFNQELSKVLPQEFIDHFITGLHIKHLVAGFDFTYGYKGQGSMSTISKHSKGEFTHTTINKLTINDDLKVSSTLIRQQLAKGDMEQITNLLGRVLSIRGKVIKGDKRGRTIGYPTANLVPSDNYLLPKVGVYAVTINHEGKVWKGMANLGYKPTFNSEMDKPSLEVHIFDYNGDLYGKELIIEWRKFIRDEKKFNGIDELVAQINRDETQIRTFLQQD